MDAGFNLIDTADVYSRWVGGHAGGESETIIGNWLKAGGKRDKVVLATKVGSDMGPGGKGLSRGHMERSVEVSLRRLQTDYIDLYQSHRDDPAMPIEETLEAYQGLVQVGKVRIIGASNFTAERLAASLRLGKEKGYPLYQTLQPEYNLYERAGFEDGLQPLCVEEGVSVIPYYALASGFLTGKYRSAADANKSPRGPGVVSRYVNERGLRILAALDAVAKAKDADMSTVSLAWLMAQPSVAAPIASATSMEQLGALTKAAELVLSQEELQALTAASAY